jgi:hypothetical protein
MADADLQESKDWAILHLMQITMFNQTMHVRSWSACKVGTGRIESS